MQKKMYLLFEMYYAKPQEKGVLGDGLDLPPEICSDELR